MSVQTGVSTRVLRPRAQILAQARIVVAALTLPIFTAMLWYAIPRGSWPRVVIAFGFVVLLYVAAVLLLRAVSIRVDRDAVIERGFFSHNRVPVKRIAGAIVLDVYRGPSTETTPQLFLVDTAGELLLRMRGEFWSGDDIERVAAAVDVPVRRRLDPVTAAALRKEMPELLYWFERWPWVGALTAAGTIAALALLLIGLMSPTLLLP
ncbi:hypothetical protein [Herbiconiux flava]|uniref:PH domain-containing protein n=1 Tax=Herbiconiux flava TaxID=881268 RepID=A0A852SIH8_9MICO|nr:hypothetical protein [Herbiconiux flava]NYD68993.1 hypothetical protein [Herbiconiux flava]